MLTRHRFTNFWAIECCNKRKVSTRKTVRLVLTEWLAFVITRTRLNHWVHELAQEAIDVNFAIHFSIIDLLFGTFFIPKH